MSFKATILCSARMVFMLTQSYTIYSTHHTIHTIVNHTHTESLVSRYAAAQKAYDKALDIYTDTKDSKASVPFAQALRIIDTKINDNKYYGASLGRHARELKDIRNQVRNLQIEGSISWDIALSHLINKIDLLRSKYETQVDILHTKRNAITRDHLQRLSSPIATVTPVVTVHHTTPRLMMTPRVESQSLARLRTIRVS